MAAVDGFLVDWTVEWCKRVVISTDGVSGSLSGVVSVVVERLLGRLLVTPMVVSKEAELLSDDVVCHAADAVSSVRAGEAEDADVMESVSSRSVGSVNAESEVSQIDMVLPSGVVELVVGSDDTCVDAVFVGPASIVDTVVGTRVVVVCVASDEYAEEEIVSEAADELGVVEVTPNVLVEDDAGELLVESVEAVVVPVVGGGVVSLVVVDVGF